MRTRAGVNRTRARVAIAVLGVLLAVVVTGIVAYRIFAPAEVLTTAGTDYPPPGDASPGVLGTLNAAPLIVDGRLRVYATTRQVRAEQPVDARTRRTPFWSFRRWPAQVTGLAAVGTTVVSRWSDGELVALDARSGEVAWRATGPDPRMKYAGRRTGASTVYIPPGFFPATGTDGRRVLVVADSLGRRGYDAATGRELWQDRLDGRCRETAFTTTTGQLASVDRCAQPWSVEFHDVATGTRTGSWRPDGAGAKLDVEPVGCAAGRSNCPAMRSDGGGGPRGWFFAAAGDGTAAATAGDAAAVPIPAPALDDPGATVVGTTAIVPDGADRVVGRDVRTGAVTWRWSGGGPVELLAVQPGRVHLRTRSGDLVTLDPANGREWSRLPLTYGADSTTWTPGYAYAADGYLAVERLAEPVDSGADDSRYYLAAQPVIFAAT